MARLGTLKRTRDRIVELLRQSAATANELAARLGLTHNAVRGHLAALEREGIVQEAGWRRSPSRPAIIYEVNPAAEAGFSKAYVPFVAQLVRILGERLAPGEMEEIMHLVGRRLASQWPRVGGDLAQRVGAASALLEDLGALNESERVNGGFLIRGRGCLLAEAVHGRPEVCRAMESLLAELLDVPVRQCCERGERPRCCFEIGPDESSNAAPR